MLVRPGCLFANVDMLREIGIHPSAPDGSPKGLLMQKRRARCDNHTVKILLKDVIANQMLARVGADEGMNLGNCDSRNEARSLGHAFHIHNIRDVPAATADVDSDPRLLVVHFPIIVWITHSLPHKTVAAKRP
jgi:hypothetical protein